MKYGNLTLGQIEAGINKIGGEEAFRRLLSDELVVSERAPKDTSVGPVIGHLRLISGAETLTLEPTDGKETIAKAGDLFNSYLDPDFRNYGCDVKGKPTEETNVTVHEMIKDGTFAQIFGGMNDNLDSLCLTQSQIVLFVRKHRTWLRTDGYGTFFLFKVGKEFFVAHVHVGSDGRLIASVYRFSSGGVWGADSRIRVVLPQLTH